MNRKILALGAVAATVSLVLTACGEDSQAGSEDTGGASDTVASQLIMGGPAEFKTRADGLPGLEKNYGVVFGKFTVTDTGGPVTITALKNGQIDAADLFSTDPSIAANDFVILEDPKNNFAAQNVLPIINKEKATEGVTKTLDAISAKLTTENLTELMVKVVTDKEDPKKVGDEWLAEQGLDAEGSDASGVDIKVGSANFPENILLANMYASALTAQGANVTTSLNIGSRDKYYPGLVDGSIDLLPEYNGSILYFVDKEATAVSSEDVLAALKEALPANLVVLEQSEAQDTDAVVVTKETAEKYNLTTIEDLAKKIEE